MAGSAEGRPARNSRKVRKAPAKRGGARPRATLRAGPENNGRPRWFAFQVQVSSPIAAASRPSASQTRSHANGDVWAEAIQAAMRAVRPRRTCPQPDTAVKEAERSMVSRMKRRSSKTSRAVRDGGEETESSPTERRKRRTRCGRGSNIEIG